MRIFVYEYLTAGGRYLDGEQLPAGSLLREGTAMLRAVCLDLSRIADTQLLVMRDSRLPDDSALSDLVCSAVTDERSHAEQFDRCVGASDYTLLIAPEINARLADLTERAERLGANLISPDAAFVRLAGNKLQTIDRLRHAGVPVPLTFGCYSPGDLAPVPPGRWVCKPVDGAGSWLVRCATRDELAEHWQEGRAMCVQVYCPGRPASVAALCGGTTPELLPPCWQWLEPPMFEYRGGALMTEPHLVARAHRLAHRAFASLPATRGYVGIDIVLGSDANGGEDVVIEVNPRLTTSYVGLRHRVRPNLGEAMWQLATGRSAHLSFLRAPLQFDADGAGSVDEDAAV